MSVPYWVQDAIFYQIFPDRFFNGDPANDPANVQPWGSTPTTRGFQGGDLRGIIQKLDYLLDLGVNALYLNPIFASASNHRYHPNDYYQIDPTLGSMADFKALLDAAHRNQMKVILDGVFNHSGRGFFAFNDILENGADSRYKDWYHIQRYPLDAFGDGKSTTYRAWWDIKALPKLNTSNPAVRKYLMDVSRYWIEQGTDGWRLDVPAEIDDDDFWAEFRQVVRQANPDAYTVGEIWDGNPRWVGDSHFDGLMHYPLRDALVGLLQGQMNVKAFAEKIEGFQGAYARENVFALYLPLGSHDTRRLATKLNNELQKVRLAFLVQFANPGAPAIYYGDEIGMPGDKDPYNRGAFPWDENQWDHGLRAFVQMLVAIRKRSAALRRGDLVRVHLSEENSWYAFGRVLGQEKVIVAINPNGDTRQLNIPVGKMDLKDDSLLQDLLNHGRYRVKEQMIEITLAPWSGIYLTTL